MAGMDMCETIAQPESPTCIKQSIHIVLQSRKVWIQGRENNKERLGRGDREIKSGSGVNAN